MDFRKAWIFPGEAAEECEISSLWTASERFQEILQIAQQFTPTDLAFAINNRTKQAIVDPREEQPIATSLYCTFIDFLRERGHLPDAVLGFGFGELAALYAANVLTIEQTMLLAARRGTILASHGGGGMVRIGNCNAQVDEIIEEMGFAYVFEAIRLGFKQRFVSGTSEGLELLKTKIPRGVSIDELAGRGPWYCPLFGTAAHEFGQQLRAVEFAEPECDSVMSTTARIERTADDIQSTLMRQMTSTIRCDESIALLVDEGFQTFYTTARFLNTGATLLPSTSDHGTRSWRTFEERL